MHNSNGLLFMFQGKGLFAKKSIKKGDTIFLERPLVSAQFLWNSLYKYKGEICRLYLNKIPHGDDKSRYIWLVS